MSRPFPFVRRAIVLAAVATPLPAMAQAVDYEALGAMMGEPVTTSVTGKPQRASEAPAAITIISRDDIARSPARDVPGLLKSLAGVDVTRWTAGQADVSVRGGVQPFNPRLLVMVDGRQVYLDHYGYTDWNLLGVQLDEIQQIELVRGPASALFGFNAASGVVNIITVDAMSDRLNVSAELGDHGINRIGAVAGTALGEKAGIRVSGGRARDHQRAIPTSLFDPGNRSTVERDEVSASLTALPGEATRLTADAGYARSREFNFLASPNLDELRLKTRTGGASVSHDTGWGSLDARAYGNWLSFHSPGTTPRAGDAITPRLAMKNRVIVGQASALARLGPGTTVRLGTEYRNNRLRGTVIYSPEISYDVIAGSAMIDARASDRVSLTGAVRIDRLTLDQSGAPNAPVVEQPAAFRRTLTGFSFNGAMLLRVGEDGQLRINAGRGLQAPSLLALGVHISADVPGLPLPYVIEGDPSIKAPQQWSGEIGYAQPIGEHLKIDGNVYVTRTDDYIGLLNGRPVPFVSAGGRPVLLGRARNIGDFVTYGAEMSLSGRFGHWTGLANYTFTDVDDDKLELGSTRQFVLDPKRSTARHKVNAQLGYDPGRWFGTVTGRYTSATHQFAITALGSTAAIRVPAALALDARLGWRLLPKVTLTLAGENLTKARGAAGSPIWADRRVRGGIGFAL